MTSPDDELSPKQAAALLGVTESTVRRYENPTPRREALLAPVRRLPGSGYRRYRRGDVEWLRDHPDAVSAPPRDQPAE